MEKKLIQYLNDTKQSYEKTTVQVVQGLNVNQKKILKTIELYYNSMYETGSKNKLGGEKPFYNIVKFRVNIATVNTDLDTKDIQIISDNPEKNKYVWLFQKEIYKWMKENNFAKFLNEFGESRAKYGSAFVKKTESDNKLNLEVCNIHNIEFDPKNFSKYTPLFETHYMSPAELYEKKNIWKNVDEAIQFAKNNKKTNNSNTASTDIKIYEMCGYIDGEYTEEKDYPYYHIFYTTDGKDGGYILYKEKITTDVYKKCDWNTVNGRSLGVGVVEDGFQSQQWTNDIIQRQKSMLDIASKIVFRTDDATLGNNILTELENGDVITTGEGKTFTQVNNIPTQMPQFTSYLQQWDQQLERVTSTFNAITGENMPSNTPYRSVAILNNAATSLYAYRMEEAGIFLQELFEEWIFPFIEKRLSKEHILMDDFTADELKDIDNVFAMKKANDMAVQKILNGEIITGQDYDKAMQLAMEEIGKTKSKRFLDIPKDLYKNISPKVSIVITGENKNKGVILESLSKILADISSNPTILQNPITLKIFTRIIELSNIGISPQELIQLSAQEQAMMQQNASQGQIQPSGAMPQAMPQANKPQ